MLDTSRDRPGERPGRMRRPGICCDRPESEDHLRRLVCRRRRVHQTPATGGDGSGRRGTGGDRTGALCRCSAEKDRLYPAPPTAISKENEAAQKNSRQTDGLFTQDMLSQLEAVFQKMASPLRLKLYLDDTPLSAELKGYMEELCALTDKLSLERGGEEVEDCPACGYAEQMARGRGLRSTGYLADTSLPPLCWGFITRPDRDRLWMKKSLVEYDP